MNEAVISSSYDVAVVGGGIIGLSSALHISQRFPKINIVILEKEESLASHQTGHNSGVIHSGIYYRPGSQKAQFCVTGVEAFKKYCRNKGINYEECGKVIVATESSELPRLDELYQRGVANGVPGLELIGRERLKEIEPHAVGIKALYAPTTGIVDFTEVASSYAKDFKSNGGRILTGHKVMGIARSNDDMVLETNRSPVVAKYLINCAGLYADKIARMTGVSTNVRILPFRGEYYVLRPESRHLVKGLIYPVPDPRFPFLGVHYTKRINGEIEAGPNAVLAWAREGYKKSDINPTEALGDFMFLGFWRMLQRNWRMGLAEIHRSLVKSVFVKDLQKLVPTIQSKDVVRGGSGVRAQAVNRQGSLLDDFSIREVEGAIHVLNAPSPGATSSLSIGAYIADLATRSFNLTG